MNEDNPIPDDVAPMNRVASFWLGPRLGLTDVLCLKSFADIGHRPILYHLEPIDNIPDFVEARDAREFLEPTGHLELLMGARPAVIADIFRVFMIKHTDYIWVDTDAYAMQPFVPVNGYLIAGRVRIRKRVASGVVRLPHDSAALNDMIDFILSGPQLPRWWGRSRRRTHWRVHRSYTYRNLPVGTFGPEMYFYFLKKNLELGYVLPKKTLYPLGVRHRGLLVSADQTEIRTMGLENAMSIHFYGSFFRNVLKSFDDVPETSYLADLCRKHGINHRGWTQ